MLRYAAANRDEAVFEDGEVFKVERPNAKEHLGFGMGIHYCPGAALAREEARIGIETLLDRLPNLRLAPGNDFAHHPSMLLRGLKSLDLEFDPR
jgi:cytochrome P450